MNKKLSDIITNCELTLSEEDSRNITSALGIKDLRKNPSEEQQIKFTRVCNSIKEGKTIEQAISTVVEGRKTDSQDSSIDDIDLEAIITHQANLAADATLSTLPNIAQSESAVLRQKFVRHFRIRVREQLQSPEYQKAFMAQIECLGELPTFNNSTTNTALPSSSSSSS
jgi:hypothetical protein